LEETLAHKEKWDILEEIQRISQLANIHYIRQKEPKGLGHAVHCARRFIGNEPFAVMLGDDIVQTNGSTPCLKQLIQVYNQYEQAVIGVQKVNEADVSKYGIVSYETEPIQENIYNIVDLVEKPSIDQAPSNSAIMGRYILTPEIFAVLENQAPGAGGEIQLTDALTTLLKNQSMLAYHFNGKRYDVGDKLGFIKATIDFALERHELKNDLLDYLNQVMSERNHINR
jgi:UTP--glucose-1-phosphate uridylyltransferase